MSSRSTLRSVPGTLKSRAMMYYSTEVLLARNFGYGFNTSNAPVVNIEIANGIERVGLNTSFTYCQFSPASKVKQVEDLGKSCM